MDTALDRNGEYALRYEKPYMISGTEMLLQKAYLMLAVHRGSYIYDRSLGSDCFLIDREDEAADSRLLSIAREVLGGLPELEVIGAGFENGNAVVNVMLEGNAYEIIF